MELNKTYLADNLDQLSTSELEQKLREEVKKDTPSGPLVRSLLRILETRKDEYIATDDEDVDAACAQYEAYCDALKEDEQKKSAGIRKTVLKAASVVLVIGVLFFTAPQMVKADRFQAILKRWTESVFELFGPLYKGNNDIEYTFNTDHPGLQQVYNVVTELGITAPVVPTWLPDGYSLMEIKNSKSSTKRGVRAFFSDGNSVISYAADIFSSNVAHSYFKDTDNPYPYEYEGVQHDIAENEGLRVAIWTRENMVFSITADCQIEVLYEIINSIYTTEVD